MIALLKDIIQGTTHRYTNFFRMCLCLLIPLAGLIAIQGYWVHRLVSASAVKNPTQLEFSFGNFADYLRAGIWPFLAFFIVHLLSVPISFVCFLPATLIMLDPENPAMTVSIFTLILLLNTIIGIAFYLFCYPVMLRASLNQSLEGIFDVRWIRTFLKTVGITNILKWTMIFLVCTVPMIFLGFLALVIGSIIGYVIHISFLYQLIFRFYRDYLEKGGKPLVCNIAPQLWRPFYHYTGWNPMLLQPDVFKYWTIVDRYDRPTTNPPQLPLLWFENWFGFYRLCPEPQSRTSYHLFAVLIEIDIRTVPTVPASD